MSARPRPGAPGGPAAALPLGVLPGVGPVRAARLARLGLATLEDLLRFAPRRLEPHAGLVSLGEARARVGEDVAVRGLLGPYRFFRRGGRRSVLALHLRDGDETLEAFWFGQPWMRERIGELQRRAEPVVLSGRVVQAKSGPALATPRVSSLADFGAEQARAKLVPVYPTTEGVSQELLRGLVERARERVGDTLADPLPAGWLAQHGLPALPLALEELHRPSSPAAHRRARRRLALERLVALQVELGDLRRAAHGARARRIELDAHERARLWETLPFTPTAGQQRVLDEILADLARPRPMRRLLQGEVGAGKTLVAVAACLAVVAAGGQAALMAPTEILAEQHALGLAPWRACAALAPVLVTGSLARAERERRLAALAAGEARLAIGTQALFSADVRFARLDLVVIDEQQRFGVAQRRALVAKGREVHALLMSATPIPRTLALALYADLELSRLDGKPPGRGPLETRLCGSEGRAAVLEAVAARVAAGERAFWVCPRIDADDGSPADASAAERTWAELARGPLARHGVELVHGRLPAEERGRRLARFRAGAARTLVATSIIEVGVDVPEASLMVVEAAERFGVAQLHQLRGRIGRGPVPATCFLFVAPEARARLAVLASEADGFAIAEVDLEQRGMGELAGARQSGHEGDGLLDPLLDLELLAQARELLERYPEVAESMRGVGVGCLERLV